MRRNWLVLVGVCSEPAVEPPKLKVLDGPDPQFGTVVTEPTGSISQSAQ